MDVEDEACAHLVLEGGATLRMNQQFNRITERVVVVAVATLRSQLLLYLLQSHHIPPTSTTPAR